MNIGYDMKDLKRRIEQILAMEEQIKSLQVRLDQVEELVADQEGRLLDMMKRMPKAEPKLTELDKKVRR